MVAGKQGASEGSGTGCSQGPTHSYPFPPVRPHFLRFPKAAQAAVAQAFSIGVFRGKHLSTPQPPIWSTSGN